MSMHSLFGDFRAFWCAGAAVLHGTDPYAAASLGLCERTAAPFGLYRAPPGVTIPAPLPPYTLLLFAAFATLPLAPAACAWLITIGAAVAGSYVLLLKTLRLPPVLVGAMLLPAAAVLWLPYGEVTPLALLGAALAAAALQRKRYWIAGAGLCVMALEPHVALGAWLCAAIFVPRMRIVLAIAGVLLVASSSVPHPGAFLEYVVSVLPVHAFAEIPRPAQYSATWIAYEVGLSPQTAIRIGEGTFVLMLAAGVAGAGALARRWSERAMLVFAPLAAGMIGGTFVHASQIVLALPFAAYFAIRERGAVGGIAAIACAFLAVPWLQGGQQQTILLIGVPIVAAIIFAATGKAALTFGGAASAIALAVLLLALQRTQPHAAQHARQFPYGAHSPLTASAEWGRYIWREQSTASAQIWAAKAPSWIMLLVLVGCAGYVLAYEKPVGLAGVQQTPVFE